MENAGSFWSLLVTLLRGRGFIMIIMDMSMNTPPIISSSRFQFFKSFGSHDVIPYIGRSTIILNFYFSLFTEHTLLLQSVFNLVKGHQLY